MFPSLAPLLPPAGLVTLSQVKAWPGDIAIAPLQATASVSALAETNICLRAVPQELL
jgi:hypothetical protein